MGLKITGKNSYNDEACVLEKLKELAHQDINQSGYESKKELLYEEFFQLKNEIDRVAAAPEFNGMRLVVSKNERSYHLPLGLEAHFLAGHLPSLMDGLITKSFFPVLQQEFSFFPLSFLL